MSPATHAPFLSICIATRNRAPNLGLTLDNVLAQCTEEVEVVVVDGASTDETPAVVMTRAKQHPRLRYLPQAVNSGVDGDFDKAVILAGGAYCWLLSDDDFLVPGAVAKVLAACRRGFDVVVVNAEVRSADLTQVFERRRLRFEGERRYEAGESARFFADCIRHLTFIGALTIRRDVWLARDREHYYGTEFVHVGVLFQRPLDGAAVAIGEPLVQIRYGVGGWTSRSFEVWMIKWPSLVWSFVSIPEDARRAASRREPWRDLAAMIGYRAKGWYSREDYRRFIRPRGASAIDRLAGAVALIPETLLNRLLLAYRACRGRSSDTLAYDLRRARLPRKP